MESKKFNLQKHRIEWLLPDARGNGEMLVREFKILVILHLILAKRPRSDQNSSYK